MHRLIMGNTRHAQWFVYMENVNAREIERVNILKNYDDKIKKLKKRSSDYEEFCKELRKEMMWRFWARCEYELIVTVSPEGKIVLKPWLGGSDDIFLDVTEDSDFNWRWFAFDYLRIHNGGKAKIDVYSQLTYKWEKFCEYCYAL